MKLAFFLSN